MNAAWLVISFAAGVVVGAGLSVVIFTWLQRRHTEQLRAASVEREQQLADSLADLRSAFSSLSREALSANAEDFLKLAATRLDRQTAEGEQNLETKKKLIDARLEEMNAKLQTVSQLIQTAEKHRAESHGSLTAHLEKTNQAAHRLHETTSRLREALASPGRRGQWGERMAEDVLRSVGMVEGINYRKQESENGRRPDFTFLLPNDRVLHMDVKFPLANYLKMLESTDDATRESAGRQFLKDVRARIREVTERDYIDAGGRSLDMLLVFIPNDQVHSYILEHDPGLFDDSLKRRVVLCSPFTLYALLCVVREAVDRFRVESASVKILELLGKFKAEWDNYVKTMSTMGKKIDEAAEAYQQLVGVRTRQLDRQLDRIELVRSGALADSDATIPASPAQSSPP